MFGSEWTWEHDEEGESNHVSCRHAAAAAHRLLLPQRRPSASGKTGRFWRGCRRPALVEHCNQTVPDTQVSKNIVGTAVFYTAMACAAIGGNIALWRIIGGFGGAAGIRTTLKGGYSVDIVLVFTRRGAPLPSCTMTGNHSCKRLLAIKRLGRPPPAPPSHIRQEIKTPR